MPRITFSANGQTLDVEMGASMLEACQSTDTPIPFGCTVGSCGTCAIVLEAGAENTSEQDEEERETLEMVTDAEGARLACQIRVQGDLTVRAAND
jgi:adenylate cyclase